MQPCKLGTAKLYKCIQELAANFLPFMTGFASWSVLMSCASKLLSRVLGHNRARPFLGLTAIPRVGKLVSPPSSTSDKYKKNVKILGPQARWISSEP